MEEMKIKVEFYNGRIKGEGIEIQWYDKSGNASNVARVENLEALGLYLAARCWGCVRWENNPTIWKDGKRLFLQGM